MSSENRSWTILLEMPPIAKGRARQGKYGHYTPARTRNYETTVSRLIKAQFYMLPLTGPVYCHFQFVFEKPKKSKHHKWHITRPDGSNLQKAIEDAANGLIFEDDSQIAKWSGEKLYCEPGQTPRIVLTIQALDAP